MARYDSPYSRRLDISLPNNVINDIDAYIKKNKLGRFKSRSDFFRKAALYYMRQSDVKCVKCKKLVKSGNVYCSVCVASVVMTIQK